MQTQNEETQEIPSVLFIGEPQVEQEYRRPKRSKINFETFFEKKSTKTKVKIFRCPKCRKIKSFSTQKHLDRHIRTVHGKKAANNIECDICSKFLKSENYLKRHMTTKHPDNPKMFICDFDGRSFAAKDYIRIHMDRHRLHQTFTCHICMKSYISKHTFRRHLKMVSSIIWHSVIITII